MKKGVSISSNQAATSGGGIFSDGNISLEGTTLENNRAEDSGGAIYNGGNMGLQNLLFAGNRAVKGDGGAIMITTIASIDDCTFNGNMGGGLGGAIRSTGNTTGNGNTVNGIKVKKIGEAVGFAP